MARHNTRNNAHNDRERDALLAAHRPLAPKSSDASQTKTTTTTDKIRRFVNADVRGRRADVLLIVSFFISGLVDAGAYNAYECFTSMQTGNTIFAALGVSALPVATPRLAWLKSVISILSFFAGSLLLTTLHRGLGGRKRWVLAVSSLVQGVFIAVSAVMVKRGSSSGSPVGGGDGAGGGGVSTWDIHPGFPLTDLIPIALLSFQAAGKVVASRATGQGGLPVVVLTTLYSDLIADPALFTAGLGGNVQRNRRIGGVVFYFGGATVGGVAASHAIGFSGALGIACGMQLLVSLGWLVWFEEKDGEDDGV